MSLPTATHYNKDGSFYLINQPVITISTLNASTITTDTLGVFPGSNTGFVVSGANNLTVLETAAAGSSIGNYQVIENSNNSTIMYAANGIPANNGGWFQSYLTTDLAGNDTLKGTIRILSSLGAGSAGGVQIEGADGSYLNVGDGKAAFNSAGLELVTQSGISTMNQYFYNGGDFMSALTFGDVGNQSSITVAAGGSNPAVVVVKSSGIDINPGSNQPITMTQGYLNVNNFALSNVSTINGAPVAVTAQPVTNWIDPYGTSITYSTIGGSMSNTQLIQFSTIAGHTYNVSVEYYSVNNGGGGANDTCSLTINNLTGGSPYGNISYLDTWTVAQSYDSYRAATTLSYTALSNNPDNASAILVGNNQTNGNSQIFNLALLATQDLGIAQVRY